MAQTFAFAIPSGQTAADLLRRARAAGRERGVEFTGDDAAGTFRGPAEGTYVVEGGELRLTIDKKPSLVPWGLVERGLRDLLAPRT